MPKIRRRHSKADKKEFVAPQLFPPVEGAFRALCAESSRVTIKLDTGEHKIPREVALYITDLWQLLGAVATRITDPKNMIDLRDETMPIPKPEFVGFTLRKGKRDRVKLER